MNRLEMGMPTLLELPGLDACAGLAAELGLDFVELNANMPEFQCGRLSAEALKRAAGEHGVRFTVHLDERMDVCDFNARVAAAYRESALEWIALARAAGIRMLNMHLSEGVHFKMPGGRVELYERYFKEYVRAICAFRDACGEAARGEVVIAVENTGGFAQFARKGIDLLLESETFALTLDVGHDMTAGGRDAAFMAERSGRIRHVHLHGATGDRCHLPLGVGDVDAHARLREAREWGADVVIEVKTVEGLRESMRWLRENGEV